jgi:hypothetical protein
MQRFEAIRLVDGGKMCGIGRAMGFDQSKHGIGQGLGGSRQCGGRRNWRSACGRRNQRRGGASENGSTG